MVVVIAITFIISWSPFYLVNIISQLQKSSFLRESNFIFTMLITHLCGFINSCFNPIIYTAMSQKFRRSFKEIIMNVLYFCSCTLLRTRRRRCTETQRFTSTHRQTLSETEANHFALNEHGQRGKVLFCVRNGKRDSNSSSGNESDIRALNKEEKRFVKKYVFKTNGHSRPTERPVYRYNAGLNGNVGTPVRGILKNGTMSIHECSHAFRDDIMASDCDSDSTNVSKV